MSRSPFPRVVIDDRYELIRILGEGAAGAVWLARDRQLLIDVALKLLRPGIVPTDEVRARFAQEAELSSRMLSPNIVKVLGRGVSENRPYIAYEWLDGESLGSHLTALGRLPLPEVKTIVVHVCWALSRAHAVGVLHRDIKPDNVFLTTDTDGRLLVKVLDFGVAELTRHAATELVGTPAYLAPEVLLGERPADARADLYALGALAYECCTGKPPFDADALGQLVLLHATQKIAPPAFGVDVDAWFARALAADPDARFSSAKEMADALHVATRSADRGSRLPRSSEFSIPPMPIPRHDRLPSRPFEVPSSVLATTRDEREHTPSRSRYSLVDSVEVEDLRAGTKLPPKP